MKNLISKTPLILMVILPLFMSACSSDDKNNSTPADQNPTGGNSSSSSGGSSSSGSSSGGSSSSSSSSSSGGNQTQLTTRMLTSAEATAYVNLTTGQEVAETETWHMAVNRTNVTLNDNVSGAIADTQDEFFNAAGEPDANLITNLMAADELNSLYSVSTTENLEYMTDAVELALQDWYIYNPTSHTVTHNADNNWLIQSSTADSYAKLSVSNIVQDGRIFTATFAFDVQAKGSANFAGSTTAEFTASTGDDKTCFDFDANATADCSGSEWDLALDGSDVVLNGGVSGNGQTAIFGPLDNAAIAFYTNGTTVEGQSIIRAYRTDVMAGIFSAQSWYAYNLLGRHGIWPNYRVYVIDTDTTSDTDEQIKLQFINYYNDTGTSGFVTVRFAPLSHNGQ